MIKTQKGMTLIELMVTMAILSVIILGLVVFFSGGVRAWITGQYQLEAQRNARQAMESMVREIRHGRSIVGNSDDDTITVSIPDLGTGAYNVTYDFLSGTTINRDSNPLISNVQSLILEYYKNDGTQIATPVPVDNEVSKIHIKLQVDVDKDSNPDITLNSDIDLRNFDL